MRAIIIGIHGGGVLTALDQVRDAVVVRVAVETVDNTVIIRIQIDRRIG